MSNRIKNNLKNLVGQTLNQYYSKVKPTISDLRYKQEYQNRIIECMVGEVDDNYVTTPETDNPIVKLEHSKEGVIKIPQIKGKTILIDEDGNETDTPGEGCRLVSVGEEEDNKLIILSKNKNLFNEKNFIVKTGSSWHYVDIKNLPTVVFNGKGYARLQHNYSKLEFYTTNKLPTRNAYDEWQLKGAMDVPYNVEGNIRFNVNNNLNHKYLIIFQASTDLNNYVFREFSVTTEIPTTYIEPKHHKTEILLDDPLRSLPNGVCDEIVGNKLIRRVGYYVLNEKVFNIGSESAGWKPQIQTIPFYKYCNQFKPELKVKINSLCFSNRLSINKSFIVSDIEGLGFSSGNSYALYFGGRLKRDKIENQDGYSVANYINNTQILYELAEPIIEELPNSITLQGFDDTTMYIENSITPTVSYGYNALIPYKQELLNQQEEVEVNTLDIENNIIPYLMDMEYNLMLMEDN